MGFVDPIVFEGSNKQLVTVLANGNVFMYQRIAVRTFYTEIYFKYYHMLQFKIVPYLKNPVTAGQICPNLKWLHLLSLDMHRIYP